MARFALCELRARAGASLSLGLAVLVGVVGFTTLTSAAETRRLETVGRVEAASQQAFDILVRPSGSRLPVETSEGLVQPGYLTGLTGITLSQWQTIAGLREVELAAPVAVVGFVTPFVEVPIDVTAWASRREATTFRVNATWRLPDGSRLKAQPRFTVSTPQALGADRTVDAGDVCGPPAGPIPVGSTVTTVPANFWCHVDRSDGPEVPGSGVPAGHVADYVSVPFPILVAAVDPDSERRLLDLDDAAGTAAVDALVAQSGARDDRIPALLSSTSPASAEVTFSVSRLGGDASQRIFDGADADALRDLPREGLFRQRFDMELGYQDLRQALRRYSTSPGYPGRVAQYWTVDGPRLELENDGVLRAEPVSNDLGELWTEGSDFSIAPAGTDDVSLRAITQHYRYSADGRKPEPPALVAVGTFDSAVLTATTDAVSRLLAGFSTAPTLLPDGRPLPGSTNIASLVQSPPLMLIDLKSLPKLTGSWFPSTYASPLSAIRVRVNGVDGVDQLSRERVRLAAQRIRQATGLDVDITLGSSPTTVDISQPKGRFGRPEQVLSQEWVRLGVATTILNELDKKSVLFFLLVLVVAAITVSNSAIASVRSRRVRLGILACLGWERRQLARLVATELLVIATAAGLAGVLLSLALARVLAIGLTPERAALSFPAALAVVALAGALPTMSAARADPLAVAVPGVGPTRRAGRARNVLSLARLNLRRIPSRALLAGTGLAVATATFTLLLAITLGFGGAVVGSVLGDAVAVEARGADYASAAATLGLATLGIANLTYLNIRDRAVELATLRALGWSPGRMRQLLLTESVLLGSAAGLVGAAGGYVIAILLFGTLPLTVVAGAMIAAGTAVILAALATLTTTHTLEQRSPVALLTE